MISLPLAANQKHNYYIDASGSRFKAIHVCWYSFYRPREESGGRSLVLFIYFFDLEILMLKYNKTYPYLLSLLHPSVQVYYSISYINIILECRKHIKFRQLIQTSTCRFCCHKIVLIHFFKEKL